MATTFKKAIKSAILYELRRNRNSVYISQDIGVFGGENGISKGFDIQFPPDRIIDAPVCENSYVGMGVGLCLSGMNAVVELKNVNNLVRALDPIINYASKLNYLNSEVLKGSLVIRCPIGYEESSNVFNNESIESAICHYPGINVIYPSNPNDVIGLIKDAFKKNCPTILFEHRGLYEKEDHIDENYCNNVKIGSGKLLNSGSDITIITYGKMVDISLEAEKDLKEKDINVEIIDLRSLYPLDENIIIHSVMKTGRAIIVHEGNKTGGISGEICAIINESEAFDYLEAPVKRICLNDTFLPYRNDMAQSLLPKKEDIIKEVENLMKY